MKYPKEYLDEIKLRLKVSQVVGKTVQLKKRGKEFIGLSPFKNEKSPSFTVSDEKEFYHCFSTGEHGNIFDFLMKTKSMGFGEAVKILSAEAGMQPHRFSNFDEKKEKRFQIYKNIYNDYLNFFKLELSKPENKYALDYISKRNISKETIEEFKLGFVPWKNNFYEFLLKNYSEEEINLTGLYYKNDKTGKYIDRFNSRIIFPINNLGGNPIAFGGRIIKESKLAKYINSPETEFYKKGRMIFNLDNAKSCRSQTNELIVVEGYMDVLSLHAVGLKNVVANSGTALTESQIDLIWKFFSDPIICLDGDTSGQLAAIRIAEKLFPLINENNKIYFSTLPSGQDPDDFIKKNGKQQFLNFINSKTVIQTYLWNVYSNQIEKNDPFAISKFEKKIRSLCYTIKDETLKKYILEDFLTKIKSLTPIQNNQKYYNRYIKKDFKILNETKKLVQQKSHFSKEQLKEYSILFLIINDATVARSKIEELSLVKFFDSKAEELKDVVLKYLLDGLSTEEIKSKIKETFESLVVEIEKNCNLKNIIVKKNEDEKKEILEDLLNEINEMNQIKKVEQLESEAMKNLDESSYSELINLKNQLNRD